MISYGQILQWWFNILRDELFNDFNGQNKIMCKINELKLGMKFDMEFEKYLARILIAIYSMISLSCKIGMKFDRISQVFLIFSSKWAFFNLQ